MAKLVVDPPKVSGVVVQRARLDAAAPVISAPSAYTGEVDLNDTSKSLAEVWYVAEVTRLSVASRVRSGGTWDKAVVELVGAVDDELAIASWNVIATITKVGLTKAQDVERFLYATIRTKTAEGSAATAEFQSYGYTPPFEPTTIPTDVAIVTPLQTIDQQDKIPTVDATTRELLNLLLTEMRITNLHLAFITREVYAEDDIEQGD